MDKLFYTYQSNGDGQISYNISKYYPYSIIFDYDRGSIWVNGNEYGYAVSNIPAYTSADNGKVLMVVNGVLQFVAPSTLYSGSGIPSNAQGNNGDIYVQTQ